MAGFVSNYNGATTFSFPIAPRPDLTSPTGFTEQPPFSASFNGSNATIVTNSLGTVLSPTNIGSNVNSPVIGGATVAGDDTIIGNPSVFGISDFGPEAMVGDSGNDIIEGNNSGNVLTGYTGSDILSGLAGNDTVYGNEQNDILSGGFGDDVVYGGQGDDQLLGGIGNDTLQGGTGSDSIAGLENNDAIYAGSGDDTIRGGIGSDLIVADEGNDSAIAGSGDDDVHGGTGNDTLIGAEGNDRLWGNAGNDLLLGGQGNDTLYAGSDGDTLHGGTGSDVFVFVNLASDALADEATGPFFDRNDVTSFGFFAPVVEGDIQRYHIDDFSQAEGDRLDISRLGIDLDIAGGEAGLSVTHDNQDHTRVLIDTDGDGLHNVDIELDGYFNLTENNFIA